MTRTYALLKLLDHGDLAMAEIIAITGWPACRARKTVSHLSSSGRIKSKSGKWTK
jgi:DNA-binding IclR family transcriptional regulator